MAALKLFTVSHRGIRIKVRLLSTIIEVHREHQAGCKRAIGETVCGFFVPSRRANAKYVGTIVLPLHKRLTEFIPHEVTHAVLHNMREVEAHDDEAFATAVGILSMRIASKIGATA